MISVYSGGRRAKEIGDMFVRRAAIELVGGDYLRSFQSVFIKPYQEIFSVFRLSCYSTNSVF